MFFTSYKIVLRSRKNTDTDNKAASEAKANEYNVNFCLPL